MALNFGQGNCQSDYKGTGSIGCEITSFGDATGTLLVKRGLNLATALATEEAYREAIKAGDIYPFLGLYNFEQATPENETSTSSTGMMSKIRSGKPQFTFQYTKGSCFHKAMYDKAGNDIWDVVLVFETGILISAKDGLEINAKGFKASYFDVGTFRLLQATDPQSSTSTLQLSSAEDFNMNHQFVSNDNLGFNVNDVNGVADVTLSVVSASATSIVVNAFSSCNTDVKISGLGASLNWSVEVGTISAVAEGANGRYTLTGTGFASGDVVLNGSDSRDNLYKGKTKITIT